MRPSRQVLGLVDGERNLAMEIAKEAMEASTSTLIILKLHGMYNSTNHFTQLLISLTYGEAVKGMNRCFDEIIPDDTTVRI